MSFKKFTFSGNKLPKPKKIAPQGGSSSASKGSTKVDPIKGSKLPKTSGGSGGGKAKVGSSKPSFSGNKLPKPKKLSTPKASKPKMPKPKKVK